METHASHLDALTYAWTSDGAQATDACGLPFESPSAMQIYEHLRLVSGLTGR